MRRANRTITLVILVNLENQTEYKSVNSYQIIQLRKSIAPLKTTRLKKHSFQPNKNMGLAVVPKKLQNIYL